MYMQMIRFFLLLKTKQSGMAMWIWLCSHRMYNSPVRALFPLDFFQVLGLLSQSLVLSPPILSLDIFVFLGPFVRFQSIVAVGENMELINLQTCMCACVYTHLYRHKPFEETLFKRLLCHLNWTLGISKDSMTWRWVCSQWSGQRLVLLDNVISQNSIISVSHSCRNLVQLFVI